MQQLLVICYRERERETAIVMIEPYAEPGQCQTGHIPAIQTECQTNITALVKIGSHYKMQHLSISVTLYMKEIQTCIILQRCSNRSSILTVLFPHLLNVDV